MNYKNRLLEEKNKIKIKKQKKKRKKKGTIKKEQVSEVTALIKEYDSIDDLLMAGMKVVGGTGKATIPGMNMKDIASVAAGGLSVPYLTSVDVE